MSLALVFLCMEIVSSACANLSAGIYMILPPHKAYSYWIQAELPGENRLHTEAADTCMQSSHLLVPGSTNLFSSGNV